MMHITLFTILAIRNEVGEDYLILAAHYDSRRRLWKNIQNEIERIARKYVFLDK